MKIIRSADNKRSSDSIWLARRPEADDPNQLPCVVHSSQWPSGNGSFSRICRTTISTGGRIQKAHTLWINSPNYNQFWVSICDLGDSFVLFVTTLLAPLETLPCCIPQIHLHFFPMRFRIGVWVCAFLIPRSGMCTRLERPSIYHAGTAVSCWCFKIQYLQSVLQLFKSEIHTFQKDNFVILKEKWSVCLKQSRSVLFVA